MDKKPKYSLFPTHPPSSPPNDPLPPLPEGQVTSPLATTTLPRPPSRGSPGKPHATFTSLPYPTSPPPLPHRSPHEQSYAINPPSSSQYQPPNQPHPVLSPEQGPSPHHFDPAFPPPLPYATKPSLTHAAFSPPFSPSSEPPPAQEPLTPPAELEANNYRPSLDSPWSGHKDIASTLKGIPTPAESTTSPKKTMHTPTLSTSTSSTSSLSSLHKPAKIVNQASSQPQNNATNSRPRTVYFHSGLGGAGNYHKAIREDNVLKPMVVGNRSNHPRFLSSLFGTLGGKKARRHQQQQQQYNGTGSGNSSDGPGSGQSSSQTLPLGAAEVMRRKMLGLDGKPRSKG